MNVIRLLTLFALSIVAGGLIPAAFALTPGGMPILGQDREGHLQSFDYVWTTVRDRHWDPEMGGVDWEGIRDELRPKVEKASSTAEARAVIREMLSRLEMSHVAVIPAKVYEAIDGPGDAASKQGATGIDVRVIDGKALVTSVEDGSPAAKAGVKPGWTIDRIGEGDLTPTIEAITREFEGNVWKDAVLAGAVKSRLSGPEGGKVTVGFTDGEDRPVKLEIPLIRKKGRAYRIGHLPPLQVWIETRRIEDDLGYVAFNMFMDPAHVMPAFNDAMESFLDAEGIIIDIRGNGGGLGGMVVGMIGWLVEEQTTLGTLYTRETELKLIANPRLKTFSGPVAVLVDGLSGSASEFFSGGLKDIGRARIFGSRTTGAALPSAFERLPNGDGFQYVVGNYISAGGEVLEGAGVTPHVEVLPTREALLQGRDPALEAAIAWIRDPQSAPEPKRRSMH